MHRVIFSMPAGTPPAKVMAAVRDFAREEFGLKHRYAMVLHTDEPHPHVHVVVKAMSEDGWRLNVKRSTLREWRQQFAKRLGEHGVEANATERAIRGKVSKSKKDSIYRATLRGDSTHTRRLVEEAAKCLRTEKCPVEPGAAALVATRRSLEQAWRAVAETLERQGEHHLATGVSHFVRRMGVPRTDRELIVDQLRQVAKGQRVSERAR